MSEDEDVHDRTHRLAAQLGIGRQAVEHLSSRHVVVEIGDDVVASAVARLAFLTACNLATRLGPYVPNLYVRVPEAALGIDSPIYPAGANLLEQALWALRAATDVKDLVREVAASSQAFDVALTIGKPAATAGMRIHFGCDGWLALVAEQPVGVPASAETNPFGALLAAAIAVGRLHAFQVNAVGGNIPRPTETWALNALTLTAVPGGATLPSNVSLPSTLLVGGGALSSAIAYAMTHIRGLTGDVDAIDKDVLKRTNSNRQITARFELAKPENLQKVDELASAWPAIRPARVMYDEFKRQREGGAGNYELAVTAVDNTEARREVALDLPKALIDGATGGLMVTLMRGCDPTESCVACAYPEIKTHEDDIWVKRLGHDREQVQKLRDGTKRFDEIVIEQIRTSGTLIVNEEVERGLLAEGWAYLKRAACGNARLDRDLPAASVSYVSAICGFLMAAQMIGEAIGAPTLVSKSRWAWGDVLRQPPCDAEFENRPVARSCAERHDLRHRIYSKRWRTPPAEPASPLIPDGRRCTSIEEMDVTFLFLDESVDLDTAWLTGVFVPAERYPHVRDAVIRITRNALSAAGQRISRPIELHGVAMLGDVDGATNEHRIQVYTELVNLVNRERLQVFSVGHAAAKNTERNLDRMSMEPGDKLYYLNFSEMVEALDLPSDALVVPVFDGVPGRKPMAKSRSVVDAHAYDAFIFGANLSQWNRIALEERPVQGLKTKPNLCNLAEPTFSDSAQSPLLQLADVVGYLLAAIDRAEQTQASGWKANLAAIAREIDPELVHRRSITITFQGTP